MTDPEAPKFQRGQAVVALTDLFNDGSYPDLEEDALIVEAGELGEVVQSGAHVESSTNVYMVEFGGNRVVGCLEAELEAARTHAAPVSQESQT